MGAIAELYASPILLMDQAIYDGKKPDSDSSFLHARTWALQALTAGLVTSVAIAILLCYQVMGCIFVKPITKISRLVCSSSETLTKKLSHFDTETIDLFSFRKINKTALFLFNMLALGVPSNLVFGLLFSPELNVQIQAKLGLVPPASLKVVPEWVNNERRYIENAQKQKYDDQKRAADEAERTKTKLVEVTRELTESKKNLDLLQNRMEFLKACGWQVGRHCVDTFGNPDVIITADKQDQNQLHILRLILNKLLPELGCPIIIAPAAEKHLREKIDIQTFAEAVKLYNLTLLSSDDVKTFVKEKGISSFSDAEELMKAKLMTEDEIQATMVNVKEVSKEDAMKFVRRADLISQENLKALASRHNIIIAQNFSD